MKKGKGDVEANDPVVGDVNLGDVDLINVQCGDGCVGNVGLVGMKLGDVKQSDDVCKYSTNCSDDNVSKYSSWLGNPNEESNYGVDEDTCT